MSLLRLMPKNDLVKKYNSCKFIADDPSAIYMSTLMGFLIALAIFLKITK